VMLMKVKSSGCSTLNLTRFFQPTNKVWLSIHRNLVNKSTKSILGSTTLSTTGPSPHFQKLTKQSLQMRFRNHPTSLREQRIPIVQISRSSRGHALQLEIHPWRWTHRGGYSFVSYHHPIRSRVCATLQDEYWDYSTQVVPYIVGWCSFPKIHAWLKHLYWEVPGFKETTNFMHIKAHYMTSHPSVLVPWTKLIKINPHGIVAAGPVPHIEPL
jgi:hypothetical protein